MSTPIHTTAPIHSIECIAPAKINLFLHITGRKTNGYHTLQTVFQLLDWGDEMRFEYTNNRDVTLASSVPGIDDENNLILRAAKCLSAYVSDRAGNSIIQPQCGVHITVKKRIPMGGGLGGGSSNAASTLLILNRLWNLGLSIDQLTHIGIQLGADTPVFIRGYSAWAEGIGERLTPIDLPKRWFVVLCPDCHVSTAEIFASPELTRDTPAITMSAFFEAEKHNDLQPAVEARYPAVKRALDLLNRSAPALMTGSGACVFAAIDDEATARIIASRCEQEFDTVVTKGINRSPPIVTYYN